MATKLEQLKEWAKQNVTMIDLLPNNSNLQVTTRLIDVLEDEVDEKYYLSEEKTKKLTLDIDLGGKLNMYDYNERDKVHSINKISPTLNTMQGGDRQPKVAVLGNTSKTGYRSHDVHDSNGLNPTIAARDYKGPKQIAVPVLTPDRLNKRLNGRRFKEDVEPMFTLTSQDIHGIAVREATKQGYAIEEQGDNVNVSYPTSKTRRGRVGKQVAQTLQAGEVNQGVVIGVGHHPFSKKREFNGYGLICPTLIATDYKAPKTVLTNNLRIRKLVPIETWRLQGFTDEQFYKAKNSGVSNSQLYKQAGNSVTVNVVDAIVKCL